ncbi:MAG: membrane protein insertase YidC [Planctomycetota bacterium]
MRHVLLSLFVFATLCAGETPVVAPESPPAVYTDVVIESDVARVTLNTDCGYLKLFELKNIGKVSLPEHLEKTLTNSAPVGPLQVMRAFRHASKHNFIAGSYEAAHGGFARVPDPQTGNEVRADIAPWVVTRPAANEAVFTYEKPGKFRWQLSYRLDKTRPCLFSDLSITNLGDKPTVIGATIYPLNGLHQDFGPGELAYSTAFVHHGGSEGKIGAETIPFSGAPALVFMRDARMDYIGLKSRFFAAWWTPDAVATAVTPVARPATTSTDPTASSVPTTSATGAVTAASDWTAQVEGFAGFDGEHQGFIKVTYANSAVDVGMTWRRSWSISASSMKKADLAMFNDVEQQIRYSDGMYRFFKVLANALTWILDLLAKVVINYGVAVVLLTVLIKAALYRTTFKQQESMLKMQRLQPELKYVQEQYKNNKQMLAQKQMELFKKHGVNPLGGCLPILIQIPIFFALFQAFSHNADLRGADFLWIHDLTLPDQVWGTPISWLDNWIFSLNPLPIIYILVSIWMGSAQKPPVNGDPTQEMMYKMMRWMPAAFGLIFYNMPSGLVLYFTVQAVISTLELKYIRAKLGL